VYTFCVDGSFYTATGSDLQSLVNLDLISNHRVTAASRPGALLALFDPWLANQNRVQTVCTYYLALKKF